MALLDYTRFRGINNVADPVRLPGGFLSEATDCDIDSTGMLSLKRAGRTKKAALTKGHSGWSNGSVCFYVDNGILKMLNTDYTATTLKSGLSDNKMSFCENAGVFFCTNNEIAGFIENFAFYDFKDTFKPYQLNKVIKEVNSKVNYESSRYVDGNSDYGKVAPPAGHLVEFFAGRLFIAKGSNVYFSDALWVDQFDMRKNFLPFTGTITLMKAATDGLWISDGKGIYWIHDDMEAPVLTTVAEYGAFPDSATPHPVDSNLMNMDGLTGWGRIVSTPKGICWCGQGGQFINLTQKHYIPTDESNFGAAIFKQQAGKKQYISITNK